MISKNHSDQSCQLFNSLQSWLLNSKQGPCHQKKDDFEIIISHQALSIVLETAQQNSAFFVVWGLCWAPKRVVLFETRIFNAWEQEYEKEDKSSSKTNFLEQIEVHIVAIVESNTLIRVSFNSWKRLRALRLSFEIFDEIFVRLWNIALNETKASSFRWLWLSPAHSLHLLKNKCLQTSLPIHRAVRV